MQTYTPYMQKKPISNLDNLDNLENQRLRLNLFIAECDINKTIPKQYRNILLNKLNDLCTTGQLKISKPIQPFVDDILESLKIIDQMNDKLNPTLLGQTKDIIEEKNIREDVNLNNGSLLSIDGNNNNVNIQIDEPGIVQDSWELLPNKQTAHQSDLKLNITDIK